MSGLTNRFNRGIRFKVNTEGFKFNRLKDVYENDDVKYYVKGLYIFSTQYGDSAVVALSDKFVNLPNHMINDVKDMIADDEIVDAINAGKVGFTIRTYDDKKHGKGKCYGVTWFDE